MENTYLQNSDGENDLNTKKRSSGQRCWLWAVFILFGLYFLMSLAGIGQEWLNHHQGWNGARRSLGAKNYLRYGYIDSKLGSMDNLGEHYNAQGKADKYEYFWHHPPMTNLLVSFAFALFGESPLIARLVAASLSWLTFLFFFLALKRLWGMEATFYSLFFISLIPIHSTYLSFVNHETVIVFAMAGMLLCYERYLETGRNVFAALLFVFMFIGTFTDFPMFPFLFFFWLFTGIARASGGERKLRFHVVYVFMVALMLVIVVLHLASMQDSMHDFYKLFMGRHKLSGGRDLSLLKLLKHWDYYYAFFSPMVYVLTLVYLVDLFFRVFNDRLNRSDAYVLSFLGAGLSYILPMNPASYIHEYTVLYMVPFFALASAFALLRIRRALSVRARPIAVFVTVVFLLSMAAYSVPKFFVKSANPIYKYSLDIDAMDSPLKYDYELDYNIIASLARDSSRPDDQILVSMGGKIRREFHYYLDRRFKAVQKIGDFFVNRKNGKYSRFLVHGNSVPSNFLEYLCSEFNFINYGHFYIFDLRGDWKYSTVKRKTVHPQSMVARYFFSLVHCPYDIVDDPAASLNLALYWNKESSIKYWQAQADKSSDGLERSLASYNYRRGFPEKQDLKAVLSSLEPPKKEATVGSIQYHGYRIDELPDGRSELSLVFSTPHRIYGNYQLVLNGSLAGLKNRKAVVSRTVFPAVPTDQWQPGLLYRVRSIVDLKHDKYDLSFEFKLKDVFAAFDLKDGDSDFGIICSTLSDAQWKTLERVSPFVTAQSSWKLDTANLLASVRKYSDGVNFKLASVGSWLDVPGCFSRLHESDKNGSKKYDLRLFARVKGHSERKLDMVYMHTDQSAKKKKQKYDEPTSTEKLLSGDEIQNAEIGQIFQLDTVLSGNPSKSTPRLQLRGDAPDVLRTDKGRTRVHITVGNVGVRQPFSWIQDLDIAHD